MDSDNNKSVYFQGNSTTSMMKLKRQLNKTEEPDCMATKRLRNEDIADGLERMGDDFFDVGCEELARRLLGKVLVRCVGDCVMRGRIVETECYPGGEDRASHSFNGKVTARNRPLFMKPGTSYVYLTYGMYHCFNISCQGDGAAVLIRALDPLEGTERIQSNRLKFQGRKNKPIISTTERVIKRHHLCNGPGKLTVAFEIDMAANEKDLTSWPGLYIEKGSDSQEDIIDADRVVTSRRIGIDSYGEPWTSKLWRFYILGNPCVSKFDRLQEKQLTADQT